MKRLIVFVVLLISSSTTIFAEGWFGGGSKWWYCSDQSHSTLDYSECAATGYSCGYTNTIEGIVYDGELKYFVFDRDGYIEGELSGYPDMQKAQEYIDSKNNPTSNAQVNISTGSQVANIIRAPSAFRLEISTPSDLISEVSGQFNTIGQQKIEVNSILSNGKQNTMHINSTSRHLVRVKYNEQENSIEIGSTKIYTDGIEKVDNHISVPENIASAINSLGLDTTQDGVINATGFQYDTYWVKYNNNDIMPIYVKVVTNTDTNPAQKKLALLPIYIYKINGADCTIKVDGASFKDDKGNQLNSQFGIEFNSIQEIENYLNVQYVEIETGVSESIMPALQGNSNSKVFYLENLEFKVKQNFEMNEKVNCQRFASGYYFTRNLNIITVDTTRNTGIPEMKYFSNSQKEVSKTISNIKEGIKVVLTMVIPIALAFEILVLITLLCLLGVRQLTLLIGKYFDLYKVFTFGYLDYSKVTVYNLGQFTFFIFIILLVYTVVMNLIYY